MQDQHREYVAHVDLSVAVSISEQEVKSNNFLILCAEHGGLPYTDC